MWVKNGDFHQFVTTNLYPPTPPPGVGMAPLDLEYGAAALIARFHLRKSLQRFISRPGDPKDPAPFLGGGGKGRTFDEVPQPDRAVLRSCARGSDGGPGVGVGGGMSGRSSGAVRRQIFLNKTWTEN